MRRMFLILLALTLILSLSGCVPGDGKHTQAEPAGFFWGVWHGWIAPISIIWGFFNRNIRVYETNNKGWGYDLGFYLAILGGFGGLSTTRRTVVKRRYVRVHRSE